MNHNFYSSCGNLHLFIVKETDPWFLAFRNIRASSFKNCGKRETRCI